MYIALLALFVISIEAELRLQHLQTTGTHNSYHIPSNPTTIHWNYTHPSLSYQLSYQNARVFELDVGYNTTTGTFDVYHIPIYDTSSNCNSLLQCASNLRDWSLANSYHGPIFVQIEPKNPSAFTTTVWNSYDAGTSSNSRYGERNNYKPSVRTRSYVTCSDQVLNVGWPTVSSSLGKIIFYTIGAYSTYNSGIYSGLYNRTSFIAYDLNNFNRTDCAMLIVDDPITFSQNISLMVQRNLIIRTRADADYYPGAQYLSQSDISFQYFDVVDTNNDWLASTTEVKSFASALGNSLSDQVVNLLVSACGANSSGFTFPQWNCAILTLEQFGYQVIVTTPTLAQMISQRNTAYASGAHLVSTDYPTKSFPGAIWDSNYWAETPGGKVYRCNPITTRNMNCSDSDFERTPSLTSGSVTTQSVTTSPVTSSPLTSSVVTSGPLTTSLVSSAALTTGSVVTTSPLTSSQITSGSFTSSPLTSSALSTGSQSDLTTSVVTTSLPSQESLSTGEAPQLQTTGAPESFTSSEMTSGSFTSGEITSGVEGTMLITTSNQEQESSTEKFDSSSTIIACSFTPILLLFL